MLSLSVGSKCCLVPELLLRHCRHLHPLHRLVLPNQDSALTGFGGASLSVLFSSNLHCAGRGDRPLHGSDPSRAREPSVAGKDRCLVLAEDCCVGAKTCLPFA